MFSGLPLYKIPLSFAQRSLGNGSRDDVPCGCRAEPADDPPQKQTKGLRLHRFAVNAAIAAGQSLGLLCSIERNAIGANNPSVTLRMTVPFAQGGLGKSGFSLRERALFADARKI